MIKAGDALTFVVDALVVVPKADPEHAPTLPIQAAANVDQLTIDDEVVGTGSELQAGQTAVLHAVFARADTGAALLSTWDRGQPESVPYVEGPMAEGLFEGLKGMKVGGRRMVSIPYAQFDAQSSQQLGLPAQVDLVVILDLLAVY